MAINNLKLDHVLTVCYISCFCEVEFECKLVKIRKVLNTNL